MEGREGHKEMSHDAYRSFACWYSDSREDIDINFD